MIEGPTDAQRAVLAVLGPLLPGDAYLAGGVAVAAHLGHRTSHHLGFFVRESDPLALEDDLILETYDGGLARLLEAFERKYPRVDIGHVVRSLAYFGDAEAEPQPRDMNDELWATIRSDIEARVRAL